MLISSIYHLATLLAPVISHSLWCISTCGCARVMSRYIEYVSVYKASRHDCNRTRYPFFRPDWAGLCGLADEKSSRNRREITIAACSVGQFFLAIMVFSTYYTSSRIYVYRFTWCNNLSIPEREKLPAMAWHGMAGVFKRANIVSTTVRSTMST